MKYQIAAAILLLTTAGIPLTAQAQAPNCKAQASEKKLAGAALKSFMTKCEKDASAACAKSAADKKLAGAAKSSYTKKCVTDSVGN